MMAGVDETAEEWKARIGIGRRSTVARLAGGAGTSQTTPVLDQTKPRVAGFQTEHWDGRVDATVTPETVRLRSATQIPGAR